MILNPILEFYGELVPEFPPTLEPFGSRKTRPDPSPLQIVKMYHDPFRTSSVRILGLHDESIVRTRVKTFRELSSINVKELNRTCTEFDLHDVTPCPPSRGGWSWRSHVQGTLLFCFYDFEHENGRMLHAPVKA